MLISNSMKREMIFLHDPVKGKFFKIEDQVDNELFIRSNIKF